MVRKVVCALFSFCAMQSLGLADEVREYKFNNDEAVNFETFGPDLAQALNAVKGCDDKTKDKMHFGTRITALKVTGGRAGFNYKIFAQGVRGAGAGVPYNILLNVQLTPVRSNDPISHQPVKYETKCEFKVES